MKFYVLTIIIFLFSSCITIHDTSFGKYKSYYENNLPFSVSTDVGTYAICFSFRNKTNDTLKIIWDKAEFVQFGKPQKLLHEKIENYRQVENKNPEFIIKPQSHLTDFVYPENNVYYEMGYNPDNPQAYPGTGWILLRKIEYIKPASFLIILPIQHKDSIINCKFVFSLTSHN